MNARNLCFLALCLVAGSFVSDLRAEQGDDSEAAIQRLQQMTAAMTQMTYQGTFVYVRGQQVDTMRITHLVDESGIHERLVAQNGPQREIVRDASGVQWIAGESHSVVQDPSPSRSYFLQFSPGSLENAAKHYQISLSGTEPLAGRISRRLNIVPDDKYRYGYNLWLEEPSGLLLKWEIYESRSKPLARLMFTDLKLGEEVDRSELRPDKSAKDYRAQASDLPSQQEVTLAPPRWAPSSLPPGFTLASHRREGKNSSNTFQHLVYSDGIAAVSVFVEPLSNGSAAMNGTGSMGTTHTFSRQVDTLQVTVVGDVPALTVKEIGMAVNPISR